MGRFRPTPGAVVLEGPRPEGGPMVLGKGREAALAVHTVFVDLQTGEVFRREYLPNEFR